MKKFSSLLLIKLVIGIFLLTFVYSTQAATLRWDKVPNTDGYTIAGYIVYWGTEEGTYPYNLNVGDVDTILNIGTAFNLVPNETVYFVVTAYTDKNIQSLNSNTAPYLYSIDELPPNNIGPIIIYIPGPVTITVD